MLLFLLLVFLPAVPIETEVVESLANCPSFFAEYTPPEIRNIINKKKIVNSHRYKVICQTFGDERRFLTLYDIENKIPVFSAYQFTKDEEGRPEGNLWKIEPQLDENTNKNMELLQDRNQAVNSDYNNDQDYTRGHLYPSSHAPDLDAQLSTFTLTNAVPQPKSFNGGSWARMEDCTKCLMKYHCSGIAYVVTGAEPGDEKLNSKINIPSKMWSAFCCYNSRDGVWMSKAFLGDNRSDSNLKETSYKELKETLGIEIFKKGICSFQNDVNSPQKNPKKKQFLVKGNVANSQPQPTTTKMTQPATSITTRSTKSVIKKHQEDHNGNDNRNKKVVEEEEGDESIQKIFFN